MQFSSIRSHRRSLATLLIMLLAVYVFVPQLKAFKSSFHFLIHPALGLTFLAFGCVLVTFLAGAITICLLSFKRLSYLVTLIVQLAASFINRLLPAGAGALGVNYLYLKQKRHSSPQAAAVVALNNALGLVGHLIIVGLSLVIFHGQLKLQINSDLRRIIFYLFIVILTGGLFIIFVGWQKIRHRLKEFGGVLASYKKRSKRLYLSLASSIVLSLANILAFYLSARAVGVQINLVQALAIYTLGIAAGSATPTPGGLGGYEAGLTVGLVGFGVSSPLALAAALLFRLLSFWLPLILSSLAFLYTSRRGWLATSESH